MNSIKLSPKGTYEWDENFETGIKRIDFEHEVFLELINSFKLAYEKGMAEVELKRIIIEIEKYAEFHFISEENFMLRINFPEYKQHQIIHLDLLEQLNLAKHIQNDFSEFLGFLYKWFSNHTVFEDKKIQEFVVQNQIDVGKFWYDINV